MIAFARPETGKTAFWVSLCAGPNGFAEQGAKIHAFINEEPAVRTQMRAISCYTGMTREEVIGDLDTAQSYWDEIKDNISMFDTVDWSMEDAISQASADAHNRNSISFDQMENSKTGKAAEADLIIGIGKNTNSDPSDKTRTLCVSKNKINGYHGEPVCTIRKEISRYEA
jgi:hypothetical protein